MKSGTLSEEEFEKLECFVGQENNIKDQLIIGILSRMNIRLNELIKLRINDFAIKTENGNFTCENVKVIRNNKVIFVQIDSELQNIISDYLKFRSYKLLSHDFLLFSERKQPFTRSGLYRRVKKILTQVNLENTSLRTILNCNKCLK